MTRNRTLMSILGFVVASGGLSAQSTVISNYSNQGYQVGQTVSQGGLVTSSYYDPQGPGYQFPSPQFPSTQFPSVSTPASNARPIFGPGPYGTTTYGTPAYAAPGTPAVTYAGVAPLGVAPGTPTVTYASPTGTAVPYNATPYPAAPPIGAPVNPYPAGYPPVTYAQPIAPAVPATALAPVRATFPTGSYQSLGGSSLGGGGYGVGGAPALQQIYPQPGHPRIGGYAGGPQAIQAPIAPRLLIQRLPLENIMPMERYTPGLATIKDGRWVISDMLYNLPINIMVKVDIVKPQDRYTPLSDKQVERAVQEIFRSYLITPQPYPLPCEPILPVFQVTLMTFPCDQRCVGMITAQLYEKGHPNRIDVDINGIWQVITWQRQTMVASACENFEQEVIRAVSEIASEFGNVFRYYHSLPTRPCFDVGDYPLWIRPPLPPGAALPLPVPVPIGPAIPVPVGHFH